MRFEHQKISLLERMIPKRFVYFPGPEQNQQNTPDVAQRQTEAKPENVASERSNIPDRLRTKVVEILTGLKDLKTKVDSLGTGLTAQLKNYLKNDPNLRLDIDTLDLSNPSTFNTAQNLLTDKLGNRTTIDALQQNNNEAMRALDRTLDGVMTGVRCRQIFAERITGVSDNSIKNEAGRLFERQMGRRETDLSSMNEAGENSRVELINEFSKYGLMMDKLRPLEPNDIRNESVQQKSQRAICLPQGVAFPQQSGATEFMKYWSEGGKIYAVDNLYGRISMFNPEGDGTGDRAWVFVDVPKNVLQGTSDVKYLPFAEDRFANLTPEQRNGLKATQTDLHAAVERGNAGKPSAEQMTDQQFLDHAVGNLKQELAVILGSSRNYNDFPDMQRACRDTVVRARTERRAEYTDNYNRRPGGEPPFTPTTRLIEWATRSDGLRAQTDRINVNTSAPTNAPSAAPAGPRQITEVNDIIERPGSNNLEWGNFTVENGKSRDLLRMKPDPQGLSGTPSVSVKLNGVPSTITAQINTSTRMIQINANAGNLNFITGDNLEVRITNKNQNGNDVTRVLNVVVGAPTAINPSDVAIDRPQLQSGTISMPTPQTITPGNRPDAILGYLGPQRANITERTVESATVEGKPVDIKIDPTTGALYLNQGTINVGQAIAIKVKVRANINGTTSEQTLDLPVMRLEATPGPRQKDALPNSGTNTVTFRQGNLVGGASGLTLAAFNSPSSGMTRTFSNLKFNGSSTVPTGDIDLSGNNPVLKNGGTMPTGTYTFDSEISQAIPGRPPITMKETITIKVEAGVEPTPSDVALRNPTETISGPITNDIPNRTVARLAIPRNGVSYTGTVNYPPGFAIVNNELVLQQGGGVPRKTLNPGERITVMAQVSGGAGNRPVEYPLQIVVGNALPANPEDIKANPRYEYGVGDLSPTNPSDLGINIGPGRAGVTRTIPAAEIRGGVGPSSTGPVELGLDDTTGKISITGGSIPAGTEAVIKIVETDASGNRVEKTTTIKANAEYTPQDSDTTFADGRNSMTLNRGEIGGQSSADFVLAALKEKNPNTIRTLKTVAIDGRSGPALPTIGTTPGNIFYDPNNDRITLYGDPNGNSLAGDAGKLKPGDTVVLTFTVTSKGPKATSKDVPLRIVIGNPVTR